ncbi:MAG: LamG-like jellyroll fold domain-containing protein, partial [Clostridia bacterium]
MKKLLSMIIAVCVFNLSLPTMATEINSFVFDQNESLDTVTNTLKNGAEAKVSDGVLVLDGTYGVKLGEVKDTFSVSAMVKATSNGGTNTIFFKDMDNEGNKWTGVISDKMKPALWTHGENHRWETIASGSENLGEWSHVAYVENNGVGTLYVNGEIVGSGSVEAGEGNLYLGTTYWSADAFSGVVDNVKVFDNALTESEVMSEYEKYVDFENFIKLPCEVISDIELVKKIASKSVTWTSSDERVIDTTGKVTRQDEDKVVTLTASIDTYVLGVFEVRVLKKPVIVNEKVLLSYKFDENDGEIIRDVSGNGNHGASYGNMEIGENGGVFDGKDDFVKIPEGVLYGHDEITIVTTFTPNDAQKNVFLYGFGNGTETGYIFLNPSTLGTNLLKFAATKTNTEGENIIASLPGVRKNEKVTVAVVISEGYARMYVDGELVMDGEMGFDISDLGKTMQNYIGKSLD